MTNVQRGILAAAAFVLATSMASAATVTITDPTGNSDFRIEYDDSTGGLFGTPILRNNTIFFLPSDFTANSTNGEGEVNTFDTIQLRLIAETPGFSFDTFDLLEEGDYRLSGPGTSVDVGGEMTVRDFNFPFISADEFIVEDAPLTTASGNLENWSASARIDASSGWDPGVRDVNLTLENFLAATSTQFGTSAFIEKKFEGIQIQVNPIPVPAALWLFAPALLALWRRRKS